MLCSYLLCRVYLKVVFNQEDEEKDEIDGQMTSFFILYTCKLQSCVLIFVGSRVFVGLPLLHAATREENQNSLKKIASTQSNS